MVVSVEAVYEGGTYPLRRDNQTGAYTAKIEAIRKKLKTEERYSYYPIMLRITDDAGNVTVKTISDAEIGQNLLLVVREEQFFPLKFIVANEKGEELGYVKEANYIDLELGETNDFELEFSADAWKEEAYNWGYRIFIPKHGVRWTFGEERLPPDRVRLHGLAIHGEGCLIRKSYSRQTGKLILQSPEMQIKL